MAYRPPHMRAKAEPVPALDGRQQVPNVLQSRSTPQPGRLNGNSSQPRPTNSYSQSIYPSPADRTRPNGRLADIKLDPMELIQSVSRSGGDGAEGDALKDFEMQDRYRIYIDERIDKHYTTFKTERHTAPAPGRQEELESLSSIVLLFRKLREGVVASGRIDDFAIEVFESSARIAILAKHIPQLNSSLSGLVPGLYHAVDYRKSKEKATPIDDLVSDMVELSIHNREDHRAQFASILLLLQLVQSEPSTSTFHSTLLQLTSPPPTRLYSKFTSDPPATRRNQPLLSLSLLSYAIQASRALSIERFNPIRYFQLLNDESVSSYERIVLSWAQDRVRDRAWEVMKKAYMSMKLDWATQWTGEDGEGWVEKGGGTCVDGVVKLK